jgi:hypothetical protein
MSVREMPGKEAGRARTYTRRTDTAACELGWRGNYRACVGCLWIDHAARNKANQYSSASAGMGKSFQGVRLHA